MPISSKLRQGEEQYVPTWSWNFATSNSLPSGSTFVRSSTATYFNSSGILQIAASNVPRFDHDPLTGAPLGYLSEMQSTNSVTYSQALTSSLWGAGSGVTLTDNAIVSPDGTMNAGTVIETTATTRIEMDASTAVQAMVTGSVYYWSYFVKNVSGSRWVVSSPGGGANYFSFQPSTGTVGNASGIFSNITARQLANGWWRVSAMVTWTPASQSVGWYFSLQSSNPSSSVSTRTGDGTSGVSIWGIQTETAGVGVTSYIPTSGAAATRAQDVLSMPLTSLPGWNPSQGGVLVAAYRLNTLVPSGAFQPIFRMDDGSSNNMVVLGAQNAGQMTAYTFQGGFGQMNSVNLGSSSAVGVRRKQAFGWSVARNNAAHDGAFDLGGAYLSALPVGMTTLRFGTYATFALNGTLESIAYYRGARSDQFVQQVSHQ